MAGTQTQAGCCSEVDSLRQTTRDLVALTTLPAVWGDLAPPAVIESLSSVLLKTLHLDLVYIRLPAQADVDAIEVIRSPEKRAEQLLLPAARAVLDTGRGQQQPLTMSQAPGTPPLRISVARFGISGEIGTILTASTRTDFPSENDRLLVNVAANQAATVLQRHFAAHALKRSELRFLELADAAPAMLWVTDPDGTCSFLSRAWYDFTGQNEETGLGFGWTNAVHPDERDGAGQAFVEANRLRQDFSCEFRLLHVDGRYRWVIDKGRPRFSESGEFLGYVGNVLDITDRKLAEQALRQSEATQRALFDEVAKSNRNLSEFLAVLAHELRNPLAPILTGLEIMRMRADSAETVVKVRGTIERQVKQLSHLIDDLLDIARVTNGKVEIKKQSVDLKSIVSNAVETSLPLIEKGHHEFSLKLHDAPLPVHADPTRIAQVVGNLLTNAAKYTPHGGKIKLVVEQVGGEAVISVTDNGVGIPPESLESVFDMFSQVGRNMHHAQGGLGIGLSLVRQLVGLHDGTVSALSDGVGKGSTFIVRLPIDSANVALYRGADADLSAATAGKTFRILVVDDNVDAATTLSSLLEIFGHELRVAHDGQQALQIAGQFQPNVVFLDIGMPDMTGYEVAQRIRKIDGLGRSVIVAVSGWGAKDDLARSKEAGFDMHFTKPVEPARLNDFLGLLH